MFRVGGLIHMRGCIVEIRGFTADVNQACGVTTDTFKSRRRQSTFCQSDSRNARRDSHATGPCFHDGVKIMVQMKNRLTKLQKVVHLVIILLALCHGYYSAVHLQDVCRTVTIRYSVKTAKQIVELFPPPP